MFCLGSMFSVAPSMWGEQMQNCSLCSKLVHNLTWTRTYSWHLLYETSLYKSLVLWAIPGKSVILPWFMNSWHRGSLRRVSHWTVPIVDRRKRKAFHSCIFGKSYAPLPFYLQWKSALWFCLEGVHSRLLEGSLGPHHMESSSSFCPLTIYSSSLFFC